MKSVTAIMAVGVNGVIGKDGRIPWVLKGDMKRFRAWTTGATVVMGRRTFESIGRPLPNRTNIVVSTTLPPTEGVTVVTSLKDALQVSPGDVFIIGGASLYRESLPYLTRCIWTTVVYQGPGDTYLPNVPEDFLTSKWRFQRMQVFRSDADNEYTCREEVWVTDPLG